MKWKAWPASGTSAWRVWSLDEIHLEEALAATTNVMIVLTAVAKAAKARPTSLLFLRKRFFSPKRNGRPEAPTPENVHSDR